MRFDIVGLKESGVKEFDDFRALHCLRVYINFAVDRSRGFPCNLSRRYHFGLSQYELTSKHALR